MAAAADYCYICIDSDRAMIKFPPITLNYSSIIQTVIVDVSINSAVS